MRVKRPPTNDKVDLNMTPMIDIVFQLLTFFLFSIKTVDTEGSFTIKMPTPSETPSIIDEPAFPKALVLNADGRGWLTSISFGGKKYSVPVPANTEGLKPGERAKAFNEAASAFNSVHQQVISMVGTSAPGGSKALEVELDCSPNLKYSYVIQAINAVSGHKEAGTVRPLIEKIKFKPRK